MSTSGGCYDTWIVWISFIYVSFPHLKLDRTKITSRQQLKCSRDVQISPSSAQFHEKSGQVGSSRGGFVRRIQVRKLEARAPGPNFYDSERLGTLIQILEIDHGNIWQIYGNIW